MDSKKPAAAAVVTSLLVALTALSCLPQPLLAAQSRRQQQQQQPQRQALKLSFQPTRVAYGGRFRIECRFELPLANPRSVSFTLFDPVARLAAFKFQCSESQSPQVTSEDQEFISGNLLPSPDCSGFVLSDVAADGDLSERFICDASVANKSSGMIHRWSSKWVSPDVVADGSPPASRLALTDATTGAPIGPDSEVAAGTNVSVVCESPAARPTPAVTLSVTGAGERTSLASGGRLRVFATVPREPRVTFACWVYNGFGQPQTESVTVTAVYGPVPSEVTTLQEASLDQDLDRELLLCSIRNNPPRQLRVRGLRPSGLVGAVRTSVDVAGGLSMAHVKLNFRAGKPGGRLATFSCGLEGSEFSAEGAAYVTGYCSQWGVC